MNSPVPVDVTHYSDPACPWAYSVSPALAVLRWRYGDQLRWRLVTVGLTERREQYAERGYTPALMARAYARFRRYGMPFATEPRALVPATARACRAIVAARLAFPGREHEALRALQLGWFTTAAVLDEDHEIARALGRVEGLDVDAIMRMLDDPDVSAAYEADRAEARSAAGSPTELQGKAAATDGPVRYTAPSLILQRDGVRLEAGGFQTIEAYDVLVANLDPTLDRAEPPEDLLDALRLIPGGLATQEVAAIMARGNEAPDRAAAEAALIELAAQGLAARTPVGDDALWSPARLARSHMTDADPDATLARSPSTDGVGK
jgi:predicted DsbA family dithiol-disulfide isomerase